MTDLDIFLNNKESSNASLYFHDFLILKLNLEINLQNSPETRRINIAKLGFEEGCFAIECEGLPNFGGGGGGRWTPYYVQSLWRRKSHRVVFDRNLYKGTEMELT